MLWTFDSEIFLWRADGNYHLLNLPEDVADDLDEQVPLKNGFGSIRVAVKVGSSQWQTSVFPSTANKTYVLPIKKAVLIKESIALGDQVTVTLEVVN